MKTSSRSAIFQSGRILAYKHFIPSFQVNQSSINNLFLRIDFPHDIRNAGVGGSASIVADPLHMTAIKNNAFEKINELWDTCITGW